jgi:hypothetical protein
MIVPASITPGRFDSMRSTNRVVETATAVLLASNDDCYHQLANELAGNRTLREQRLSLLRRRDAIGNRESVLGTELTAGEKASCSGHSTESADRSICINIPAERSMLRTVCRSHRTPPTARSWG